MPAKLSLVAAASFFFATHALAQGPATTPQKLNAVLCNTQLQAIHFAVTTAAGKTEPIAIDLVNKAAGAEVCGRYIGYAVVEIQKTENKDGGLFMLAGLRFVEDGRLAWTASWVAPFNSTGLARGT